MKAPTFTDCGEPVTQPPRHADGHQPGTIRVVSETSAAFVRLHARLAPVAFVPEIRLHQADEPIGLWELTEGEFRSEQPPPFWAFAWAGGQALARYVLDHPDEVAGRRVLDLASGSGLVAIAAARAGAAAGTRGRDRPAGRRRDRAERRANEVAGRRRPSPTSSTTTVGDAQVVLAGDVFYSQAMADRMLRFLRRAARAGARCWSATRAGRSCPGAGSRSWPATTCRSRTRWRAYG